MHGTWLTNAWAIIYCIEFPVEHYQLWELHSSPFLRYVRFECYHLFVPLHGDCLVAVDSQGTCFKVTGPRHIVKFWILIGVGYGSYSKMNFISCICAS